MSAYCLSSRDELDLGFRLQKLCALFTVRPTQYCVVLTMNLLLCSGINYHVDLNSEIVVDQKKLHARNMFPAFSEKIYREDRGKTRQIIKIDETLLTKHKSNCGRLFPEKWMFRGIRR